MLLQSKGHGRRLECLFFTFRKLLMFASAYSKIDIEIHKKKTNIFNNYKLKIICGMNTEKILKVVLYVTNLQISEDITTEH